jgi:hypothetical protein
MPAPLIGAAAMAAARIIAGQGAKRVSKKVATAMAREAAGPRAKAPFGTYRKPSPNRRPRLRDTDDTPRNTTVRQLVGPKTKSGKMIEKKFPAKINTKPPVKKAATKTKAEPQRVTKVRGRVIAISKPAANPRIRKREEAQLRISRREYTAERQRQAKLAARRGKKEKTETPEVRPEQPTIESRLTARAESVPVQSRNQSAIGTMSRAELRRYAQLLRESGAKAPNVSRAQIAGGRARALQPTAERRAAAIKEIQKRAISKAKARGMTDAQINKMIANAKAEAAAIARRASK